ncbi:MAG: hypothetical protein KDA24_18875 [Deltaproteobacteria bacterium]|nr:hypothetical protein [Deltaproteobacteria bacterium]
MLRLLLLLLVLGPANAFAQDGDSEESSDEETSEEAEEAADEAVEEAEEAAGEAVEEAEEAAGEAVEEAEEAAGEAVEEAEGAAGEAVEEAEEAAGEAVEEAEEAADEAEEAVEEATETAEEAVEDAAAPVGPAAEGAASAPDYDKGWLHIWGRVGAQVFPLGVQGSLVVEPRVALHRSKSVLFQTTFAGAGLYLRATPAFLEVGPQISLKPIEIFELNVAGKYVLHFPGKNARVRFDDYSGKSYADRNARTDVTAATSSLYFGVSPVLKLKGGPVIVVYGGTFGYHHTMVDDADDQLLYDAGLDLLFYKREWTISHQAVVMAEILDGKKTPTLLRVGATIRQRAALRAKDQTVNLGLIATFKPGRKAGFPEILFLVMPYLRDQSGGRVLGPPWIALALTWTVDPGFKTKGSQSAVLQTQRAMGQMNSIMPMRPF